MDSFWGNIFRQPDEEPIYALLRDIPLFDGLSTGELADVTAILHRRFDEAGSDFKAHPVGTGPFALESHNVGANAVLGPGVEIGSDSVIAAGATVTQDIDSGMIVLGSPPGQQIEELDDWIGD